MDFTQLDDKDFTPIYVQIKNIIEKAIKSGFVQPGDPVPSVREIARSAGVNPNTAAKALRELTLDGTLVSRRGFGYIVAPNTSSEGRDAPRRASNRSVEDAHQPPKPAQKSPWPTGNRQSLGPVPRHPIETQVPEYVKIQNAILQQIASGELKPGDSIPAIRATAIERNLNENTVAKAYRELQLRGVVTSRRGVGYFIAEPDPNLDDEEFDEHDIEESSDEVSLESPIEPMNVAVVAYGTPSAVIPSNDNPDSRVLQEIIDGGESVSVEFKSTLRMDLRASTETGRKIQHTRIEHSVLKTIAAFLNSQGGKLLIGVDDQGKTVGIESDGFDNADRFLLHLYNLIRHRLGNTVAAQVESKIIRSGDGQVCLVTCEPSPYPVFLNDNQGHEEFYVRMGPSSSALRPSEIHTYISHRFGS